ncbi:hypothetical protein K437DRAFT_255964 [Tilletiaria anomala UBC 951]|uniref:Autophagy-related protein n=1 Tax=Tilletiaria anomala (strain ATCC 24038 / CBS 436.72 / UBC 951) TaxID=1037660 RepID=A0A066W8Q6_TILAU|nr:uncharacterized protein K437DRAFT_255964 [Tilletiaria anomala UBC 951]KDN47170.1 hypothetical protein K437DRAFT_255964 [Tilletiaria anomala UBC 951]
MRRYQLAYGASSFATGPAFGGYASYVSFQIQNIGYLIGHEPGNAPGSGCDFFATTCLVPMAGAGDINLTSFILYLNAISYAVSGALVFIVAGIGDYTDYKREQYIFFIIVYGALCLPITALTGYSTSIYNTLAGLYVVFNIIGFLVQVWGNIFIPYCMREMHEEASESKNVEVEASTEGNLVVAEQMHATVSTRMDREIRGVRMSIWGSNSLNLSILIFYVVVICLIVASATTAAGLTMTTVAGAVCLFLALVAWPFLPSPSGRPLPEGKSWFMLPFTTFAQMFQAVYRYPDAFRFLLAYTIYNDTLFAFGTVTGTLFNLTFRPSLLEFTGYSMVGPGVSIIVGTAWRYIFPRTSLTLRHWAIISYSIVAFIAFWAILGMSPHIAIGFKQRWEFYLMAVLQNAAGAIVSPLFRVLFSELFPKGSEIRFFGFQLVLSCSTTWIPQVINGPIVNATNNIRLPAAVCLPAFLICIALAWWTDDVRGAALVESERHQDEEQRARGPEPLLTRGPKLKN